MSSRSSVTSSSPTVYGDDPEILYIAVMGPTGVGKSSFINLLAKDSVQTGESLESCTDAVQCTSPFEFEGRTVALIDTPGFDDIKLRDVEVLQMVAAYLSFSHQAGRKLAGVIYLHRILDNRMGGISTRNFKMFRSLCGDSSLKHVAIVTTMWDQLNEGVGGARELELRNKDVFFKPAIDKGAQLLRHSNTTESAQTIIRTILDHYSSSVTLQIQKELSEGIQIDRTSAGVEICRETAELIARHQEDMRSLATDLHKAIKDRDEETKKELEDERARLREEILQLQKDSANIVSGYNNALKDLDERMRKAEYVHGVRATGAIADVTEKSERFFPGALGAAYVEPVVDGPEKMPLVGLWGKMCFMLAPFSLSWKNIN